MLAAFLTNQYVFGAVMLFALIVMMWEFLRMTCGNEYKYSQILSILSGATLFTLIYCCRAFGLPGRMTILAFVPVFILMINSLYVKDKSRFDKFANLYTAILYIAVPWSVLNFAVFTPEGAFSGKLILCFFCIIWGSDVGAYCFGMLLGQKYGKKLFPSISPKKSWIGFWGGLFTSILVAVLLNLAGIFTFKMAHCIAMGAMSTAVAVLLMNIVRSDVVKYIPARRIIGLMVPSEATSEWLMSFDVPVFSSAVAMGIMAAMSTMLSQLMVL